MIAEIAAQLGISNSRNMGRKPLNILLPKAMKNWNGKSSG